MRPVRLRYPRPRTMYPNDGPTEFQLSAMAWSHREKQSCHRRTAGMYRGITYTRRGRPSASDYDAQGNPGTRVTLANCRTPVPPKPPRRNALGNMVAAQALGCWQTSVPREVPAGGVLTPILPRHRADSFQHIRAPRDHPKKLAMPRQTTKRNEC